MVKKLRRDLAYVMSMQDPEQPGMTFYQTAANGTWNDFYTFQLQEEEDEPISDAFGEDLDFSLEGMRDFMNSQRHVGQEVFKYVSDLLGLAKQTSRNRRFKWFAKQTSRICLQI